MKAKKTINTIIEEVIANGIGWLAGLASVDLLDNFFIRKSFWNFGGIFSKRIAVSKDEFSLLEWVLTAIIGFVVMLIINKFVRKKFFKKKAEEPISDEVTSEEQVVISKVYEELPSDIIEEEQPLTEYEDTDLSIEETDIPPKVE